MIRTWDVISDKDVLNAAFVSKTDTNAQNILGPITINGAVSLTAGLNITGNTAMTGTVTWSGGGSVNANAAYTHISNNGSDHSYINQSVTTTSVPKFYGLQITDPTGPYTADFIKTYGGDAYGLGAYIQTGGALIIGSGEGPATLATNLGATLEELWLTSDTIIKLMSNVQAGYASRKEWLLGSDGNMTAPGSITASGGFIGNASTATKLATARTITLTGDITGSGSFDGAANLSIATSIGTIIREEYTIPSTGLAKDTDLTIPNSKTYTTGTKSLQVIRDGILQKLDTSSTAKDKDYWEVSTTQIKFNYNLPPDSIVEFVIMPF